MSYEDLLKHDQFRQIEPTKKENQIASKIIVEYLKKIKVKEYSYYDGENFIGNLMYLYFSVKGTSNEKYLLKILEKYKFNYSMSIHNAIYYLLGKKSELYKTDVDPLLWPGIKNIEKANSQYILDTVLGTVIIHKASQIFSNTHSYYIFRKKLMGQCYARTYDFLKENRNYHAVLSYMPNFFYGGHYHAYLENNSQILDIASNACYDSIDDYNKIFCGEIIKKLSYDEVEENFEKLEREIPKIKKHQKLQVLTLYYDKKHQNLL